MIFLNYNRKVDSLIFLFLIVRFIFSLATQLLVVFFLINLFYVSILLFDFKFSLNSEVFFIDCLLMGKKHVKLIKRNGDVLVG